MNMKDVKLKSEPMTPTTPCLCGSGKAFGGCCGALRDVKDCTVVTFKSTKKEVAHFIVCNPFTEDLFVDENGKVPVFATRAQAFQIAEKTDPSRVLGVAGFAEDAFAEVLEDFRRGNVDHYFVPESTVAA